MGRKQPLANVLGDMEAPRAPDVRSRVLVPLAWLLRGETIRVPVPRLATCDGCKGGGCERCSNRGAFTLHDAAEAREPVELRLPEGDAAGVVVRLAHRGVIAPAVSPGHWLLEVHVGAEPSPGVQLVPSASAPSLGLWLALCVGILLLGGVMMLTR